MTILKTFLLLYAISFAFFLYLNSRNVGTPFLLPGDLYIKKVGPRVYIPLGSSFILAVVLYVIINLFT